MEGVTITDVAAEGKSLARVDDMVLFIPFGAPGDVVDVQIRMKKKNFMEGNIIHFHTKSGLRREPFCEHFGTCGGCKWQHLPYSLQADYKRQHVIDSLERIGGFRGVAVAPVIVSPQETHYRNKLEYTFSDRRWLTGDELPESGERPEVNFNGLGFHLPGQFDRILDINICHLQPEPSNSIRLFVKSTAEDLKIPFYNQRRHEGNLRNLIIRNNKKGEFMVILSVADFNTATETLLSRLKERFPEIISLNYVVNSKKNDDISDLETNCFSGERFLIDDLDNLLFRIGPVSFYQTNSHQVVHLYRKAVEFAALTGVETVYDLYTGTGTIANFAAGKAQRVVGIEYSEQAVADARENSLFNNIENTTFVAGDIAKVLNPFFVEEHGAPHVIITDPPRAGMHPDVVKQIVEIAPDRIVYVSCNPATQARDLAMMQSSYSIAGVQPVDMFPQTHHIENIVLLKRTE